MAIAALVVRVTGDLGDLNKALNRAVSDFDRAGAGFRRAGEKIAGVGQALTVGVTVPFIAAGAAAVKFASDAEETASKMDAVFGPAADDMNRRIEDMKRTIPESTQALQGMAAEIQDLLVPLGLAPAAAADMTDQVVRLAADLASFNNIPVAEALERIRSGLVGQNEPLLKFGVALDAAGVKQEAFRLGLIETEKEFDAAARAQAAFSLILKGTTAAHGDAAETAASTANQFKFLRRDVQDLAVTIGNELIPFARAMVGSLSSVVQTLNSLNPAFLQMGLVVAGAGAAIGPVLLIVGNLTKAVGALAGALKLLGLGLGPAGAVIVGIGLLITLFAKLKKSTEDADKAVAGFGKDVQELSLQEAANEFHSLEKRQIALAEQVERFGRAAASAGGNLRDSFVRSMNAAHRGSLALNPRMQELRDRVKALSGAAESAADSIGEMTQNEREAAAEAQRLALGAQAAAAAFSSLLGDPVRAATILIDRQKELQSELAKLNTELAFTTKAEEAAKLVEQIDQVTAAIARTAAGLRDLPPGLVRIIQAEDLATPRVTVGARNARGGIDTEVVRTIVAFTEQAEKTTSVFAVMGDAAKRAGNFLLDAAGGFLGAVGDIGKGFISIFNPLSIVSTAFDQAIRNSTADNEKFQAAISKLVKVLVDALVPVVEALAPAIEAMEPIFRELAPVLKAVGEIFAALFKAVAPILGALVPLLRALFPVFKFLAIVSTFLGQIFTKAAQIIATIISAVAQVIGNVIVVIGKAIDALPFISGRPIINFGKSLLNASDEMDSMADAFGDAFDQFGRARDEIRDIELEDPVDEAATSVAAFDQQVVETTGSLLGLADAATSARDAVTGGAIAGANATAAPADGAGSVVIQNLTVPLNPVAGESDAQLADRWLREMQRRARTAGDRARAAVDSFAVLEA